jgi:hypothetical protein
MKRERVYFAIGILLAALLFFVVLMLARPQHIPGVVVRGKPIDFWVEQSLKSYDYQASEAIREAGTNALPFLRDALERRTTVGNKVWVSTWPHLPGFLRNYFPEPVLAREARMNAVALLRDMPEISKTIIPDLLKRLSDEDQQIRLHTAITFGNIGPAGSNSIPTLRAFVRTESHTVRVYSANALWKVSGEVEPSLSVLEQGLQEKTAKFRWAAPVFHSGFGRSQCPSGISSLRDATVRSGFGRPQQLVWRLGAIGLTLRHRTISGMWGDYPARRDRP